MPNTGPLSASMTAMLRVKDLEDSAGATTEGVICALNVMLDLKDLRTGLHATRLAEWAVRVGEQMGIGGDHLRDLEIASLLHDIGKIGVPDAVLLKPGKLNAEEVEQARRHPEYGWAILQSIPGFERASLMVLHHHERFDGNGYPSGLKAEEIPVGARVVAVVDAFDAMVSDRAYRKGLPQAEAFRRLRADSGTQFDPDVTERFIGMIEQSPVLAEDPLPGAMDEPHPLLRNAIERPPLSSQSEPQE